MFNVLHGFPGIGIIAEISAGKELGGGGGGGGARIIVDMWCVRCSSPVFNVGIGLALFSTEFSRFDNLALLWLFIAYNILLNFVTIGMCKLCSRKSRGNNKSAPKADETDAGKKGKQEERKERKPPSPDSPFRWVGLAIFVTVTVLVVLALIVLIALPME